MALPKDSLQDAASNGRLVVARYGRGAAVPRTMAPTGDTCGVVSAGRDAGTFGTNIVALHRLHW
jgi:hypothetical protein